MGGLFIVEDEDEGFYPLPRDEYEIPLIVQDKRLGDSLSLTYGLGMGPDMLGYLGDTAFGNGVANPTLDVRRAQYRLRILHGSNARILDLGLSSGQPLTLIGSDGGLLGAPTQVERIMLRSLPFHIPGMMMGMMGSGGGRMGRGRGMMGGGGGRPQGTEMDLLEFVCRRARPRAAPRCRLGFPKCRIEMT